MNWEPKARATLKSFTGLTILVRDMIIYFRYSYTSESPSVDAFNIHIN